MNIATLAAAYFAADAALQLDSDPPLEEEALAAECARVRAMADKILLAEARTPGDVAIQIRVLLTGLASAERNVLPDLADDPAEGWPTLARLAARLEEMGR